MPETSAPKNLRIVLFGMPDAGKSSLLGAFVQAAQLQPQILGAQLADPEGKLTELKKQVYEGKAPPTRDEMVSYPATLQPPLGDGPAFQATFLDCDGRLAQEYLGQKRSLDERSPLAQAMRQADALVLVVAPSADTAALDQTFVQFGQFLHQMEEQRGRSSEIAGLPVYLVLTKCDLYARKEDGASQWMQRLEDGKRKIAKRFQDFLATEAKTARPFGVIDLHLWAAATRRPTFGEVGRAPEPYGVAELFHLVLDSARAFHDRRGQAHQRLHATVAGLVGLLAVMALLAGGFLLSRPSAEVVALEGNVRSILPESGAAPEYLREPLDDKIKQLAKIQEDPHFAQLPGKLQDEVRNGKAEFETYRKLLKKFKDLGEPRFLKAETDIEKKTQELDSISLPPKYDWSETRLAKNMRQYRAELQALGKTVAGEKDWFQKQIAEGDDLRSQTIPGVGTKGRKQWIDQADAFSKRKERGEELAEVPGVPRMKYRELYEFPSLKSARRDWREMKANVERIRKGLQ